ncbi:hypothetical protein ARMSODRAFT_955020 [Armillaria solidipes]|uniref:Uncharacterized protein n=1 Tax=Armillaria solidipes TaxID=1076256 RepID=A0A2H3BNK1_9AGAR|nr:hypothetical protein ARMSODRAFT_955020 [Armillaria solidipes]
MVVSIGNPQHCCRAYSSVCSERQLACRYESPGTLLGCRNGRFQDYGRIACASQPIKRRRRRFEDQHTPHFMGPDVEPSVLNTAIGPSNVSNHV